MLWQGGAETSLASLTEFFTTGADGVLRMWRVAGVEVAAGEWARVNTTEPGVSLYIDAAGAALEGVPAEQAARNAAPKALCVPGIGDACIAGRLKKELDDTTTPCSLTCPHDAVSCSLLPGCWTSTGNDLSCATGTRNGRTYYCSDYNLKCKCNTSPTNGFTSCPCDTF